MSGVSLMSLQLVTQHLGCGSVTPTWRQRCSSRTNPPTGDMMRSLCKSPSFPPGLPCCSRTSSHLCAQLESHLSALANSLLEPAPPLSPSTPLPTHPALPSLFFTNNVCSNLSVPAMAAGVSILSDLPYSVSAARGGDISREMEAGRRQHWHIYCLVLTCLLFIMFAK